MVGKRYLMTPGPTSVPPEVLAAMARPIVHHRGPEFRAVFADCLQRLKEVHRTGREVLLFSASGTGAMESAVANLCTPGTRVVVVAAGYFGERWAKLAETYGCEVDVVAYEWGEIPSPDDLAGRLRELGGTKVVFLTQSETSTGVVADVEGLARAAAPAGALVVVDAVSSLGAVPLELEEWGVDVAVSGSQKALMTPPGLATAAISDAAWAALGDSPRFYFDWSRARAAQARLDSAFTPAVSLVVGLDVALAIILERGLEAVWEHHARLGRACRAGAKALGLELFSPDEDRSAVVTALRPPAGVGSTDIVRSLRDRFGITIADGQGPMKGSLLRIGHIGYYDVFDVTTTLAALELALVQAGAEVERGIAVTRALEAYGEAARV